MEKYMLWDVTPWLWLPGNLTVKLLDVAYKPELVFNLFSPMTANKQGVGFRTEEENFSHVTEVAHQMGLV